MGLFELYYPARGGSADAYVTAPATEFCYGCGGKGWVEVRYRAERCPVCDGKGWVYPDPNRPKSSHITWDCDVTITIPNDSERYP